MSRTFKPKPPPFTLGDPIPAACDAHDLARIFGKSLNTIYDWHKFGKLRRLELSKPLTSKRWSGRLVQEFLDKGSSLTTAWQKAS